ncbi:MAG TPA: tetratricopeptide repeat protein [Edaphobacter sp.]
MRSQLALRWFRISTVLTVSLALGFTAGCSRDPNKQKQKYLESGKRYAADNKLKEAAIQFSNALRVDHNFAAAHYELSKVYVKQGNMLPAYAELLRTVDLQPSNVQARIDLGNMLLAGRQPDRATEQAKAVLAIDSNNADAYALLAGIATSKGDRTEALAQIQHALSIDPNRANFHTALGLLQASDPAAEPAAEEQLRKAISLDPKSANSHIALAAVLERKGDLPGALQAMQAAVAADPKNVTARVDLGRIYLRQGDKAKAEEIFRQAADDLNDSSVAANLLESYYISTQQLDRAEPAYAALVAKHPKSTPLKLAYARILLINKDIAKAKPIADDLEKTDAGDPEVAVLNAMLLLNDNKSTEAFNLLQKAAKNSPENVQVKVWLGRAARMKGDQTVALQSFRDAAKLNPRNFQAQEGLAQAALDARDFGLLGQAAEAAIAINPQLANPYIWRGMAEGNQKQLDKAEADFKQAMKLDPKNALAPLSLAELRLSQKNIPEAKTLLEQALTNDPNSARAMRLLVFAMLVEKQPAKAIDRVQQQITKVPQNSDMYTLLAELQLQTGDINAGTASAQKAMQLNPNNGTATMVYTRAALSHGNPAQAIDTWQQWLKTHPNDAQANTIMGALEEARGDQNKAMGYYKAALKIQPEQPVAANNLAYLMVESGQNTDVALSLAQIARRAMPNSDSTADTLAWVYYQKGSYSSARDLLEDALKTSPNNAAMHYHLGMTYSKLANTADAVNHLKKAVALAPNSQTSKDAEKALGSLS